MQAFAVLLALIFAVLVVKKIYDLSSDPKKPKDFFPDVQNKIKSISGINAALPFFQLGGTINDITGINRTAVYGILKVKSENEIKKALKFAREQNLKVSIIGARHSMGGQAFASDALILDMRSFNKMSVSVNKKVLTVESGAIWHDIQNFLNDYNLSVEAMQSIDVPTVGGTIAVNAHGMDHRIGSIAGTIISMRIMLADGSVKEVSQDRDADLYRAVIGGYGLFGVILDVQLKLMDNVFYNEVEKIIKTSDFLSQDVQIGKDKAVHMFYGRLSTAPSSFLNEMIVYEYKAVSSNHGRPIKLVSETYPKARRLVLNLGRKSNIGREIKWWAEKYLQPYLQKFPASRNQIMHRSYLYLKNNLENNTDVLQEYFLPKEKLMDFLDSLKAILNRTSVVTRNVEIRSVHKENIVLDYAHGNWFGVVLYLNFDVSDREKIKAVHLELIDLSQKLGGSFYLPYQLSASREQIEKSYPKFGEFLKLKEQYDPGELFTNEFYKKYSEH